MTEEHFMDIKSRLNDLAESRGLSVEWQKSNFEVNYSKKLVKFFEAKRDNNDYKMIDSICDMIIVAIGAGKGLGDWHISTYYEATSTSYYTYLLCEDSDIELLCIALQNFGYNTYRCLLEKIKEIESRTGFWNESEGKWCEYLGAYTEEEAYEIAKEKGFFYNFGLVYDNRTLKPYWVSDTNDSSKWDKLKIKKWYKPDYSIFKLVRN